MPPPRRPSRPSRAPARPSPAELIAQLPPMLQALAQKGELRRHRAGELLIREGESGDTLYLILDGRLRAFARNDRGDELTHGIYGAGEYVGEMSLDGGRRSASVEAYEDSLCAMVTRRTLTEHIVQHPQFAFELIGKLIRRVRAATMSARQIALNNVYGRIKYWLENLAEPQPDGTLRIAERLTHMQLAQLVGCGRPMVSRVMKDLETGGLVLLRDDGSLVLVKGPLPDGW